MSQLPRLRKELEFFAGPEQSDGSPTYTIFDSIENRYFKVSWIEGLILRTLAPNITIDQLIDRVNRESTANITAQDIELFFIEVQKMGLFEAAGGSLQRQHRKQEAHTASNLFKKLFYLRFALVTPDHFLERTLSYVRFLGSPFMLFLFISVTLLGFGTLLTQFEQFLHTFTYFYNPKGLIAYTIAILMVKCIHELSHAYVAKRYGVHVASIGVAFIVMWPVLYTDVTHSWVVRDRKQRLLITFAGVISELIVAGICTVLWNFSEPGIWQSIFFVLASVTWISSLLVNLNPAMRFDGYYALCDLVGIDNLQPRAFATTRWLYRKWLFGVEVACPELKWSMKKMYWLAFYSVCTWIYRLFVYVGIGLFFYWVLTKSLGIIITVIALFQFFALPVIHEIQYLFTARIAIKNRLKFIGTVFLFFAGITWFALPMPYTNQYPSVALSRQNQIVFNHNEGRVTQANIRLGSRVKEGDLLLVLESENIEYEIKKREKERAIILSEIDIISAHEDEDTHSLIPEKRAKLSKVKAELDGFYELKSQNNIYSHVSGEIYDWDEWIDVGQYIKKNQAIGRIADLNQMYIHAFISEKDIQKLSVGDSVTFYLNRSREEMHGKVEHLRPVRVQYLAYPQLGSVYGGDLPVISNKDQQLLLLESYYQVEISLEEKEVQLKVGETGYTEIYLGHYSRLMELLRWVLSTFWRESAV